MNRANNLVENLLDKDEEKIKEIIDSFDIAMSKNDTNKMKKLLKKFDNLKGFDISLATKLVLYRFLENVIDLNEELISTKNDLDIESNFDYGKVR